MTDHSEHAVVNHLVETCRDGERGFRLATELVTAPDLKVLFAELASERRSFADELLPHAQRLGGAAPQEQTTLGSLHRGWMAMEAALLKDDTVILQEVDKGNRATLDVYFDAIAGLLPPDTRDVVERQFQQLQLSYAKVTDR